MRNVQNIFLQQGIESNSIRYKEILYRVTDDGSIIIIFKVDVRGKEYSFQYNGKTSVIEESKPQTTSATAQTSSSSTQATSGQSNSNSASSTRTSTQTSSSQSSNTRESTQSTLSQTGDSSGIALSKTTKIDQTTSSNNANG